MIGNSKKHILVSNVIKSWEFYIFILLIMVFVINSILSPDLMRISNLTDATLLFMENSIIALPMALAIIAGFIDISVASIAALSGVMMGICYQSGINIWYSLIIGILVGGTLGFINGLLITKLKMSSIVITLTTMIIYRGICYVLLGDRAIRNLPEKFGILGGAYELFFIPLPLIIFIVFSLFFGFLLHFTTFGREIFAIGANESAAIYSGIFVDKVRLILSTILGLVSGISGILLTSRIGSARPDIANGNEMEIITIVLLGGVYIFGGRGSILGVFISSFIIGYIHYGLAILRIQETVIKIVIGGVLIISLVIPVIIERLSSRKYIGKKYLLKE